MRDDPPRPANGAPSKRELDRAQDQGEAARRAGKPRKASAWQFGGERSALLNDAWLEGWDREDARRKRKP